MDNTYATRKRIERLLPTGKEQITPLHKRERTDYLIVQRNKKKTDNTSAKRKMTDNFTNKKKRKDTTSDK